MKFNYIKGTEKDFECAPDWATVKTEYKWYGMIDEVIYYLVIDSKLLSEKKSLYNSIDEVFVKSAEKIIAHREPITETLSWYEKGELPPVGTVCEVQVSDEWFATEIIGFTKSGLIVFTVPFDKFNRLYDSFDASKIKNNKSTRFFRPLKSKQEKEVEELVTALSCAWRESSGIADLSKMAQKLYDLGYRKIEK